MKHRIAVTNFWHLWSCVATAPSAWSVSRSLVTHHLTAHFPDLRSLTPTAKRHASLGGGCLLVARCLSWRSVYLYEFHQIFAEECVLSSLFPVHVDGYIFLFPFRINRAAVENLCRLVRYFNSSASQIMKFPNQFACTLSLQVMTVSFVCVFSEQTHVFPHNQALSTMAAFSPFALKVRAVSDSGDGEGDFRGEHNFEV